jgi:hypothetical protein
MAALSVAETSVLLAVLMAVRMSASALAVHLALAMQVVILHALLTRAATSLPGVAQAAAVLLLLVAMEMAQGMAAMVALAFCCRRVEFHAAAVAVVLAMAALAAARLVRTLIVTVAVEVITAITTATLALSISSITHQRMSLVRGSNHDQTIYGRCCKAQRVFLFASRVERRRSLDDVSQHSTRRRGLSC